MRKAEIETFANFIRETEMFDLFSDLVIFRGQPVKGNLVPSIARKDIKVDTTAQEKKVLEQLSLMGASLLSVTDSNPLELLVLAQHFGLKTRACSIGQVIHLLHSGLPVLIRSKGMFSSTHLRPTISLKKTSIPKIHS